MNKFQHWLVAAMATLSVTTQAETAAIYQLAPAEGSFLEAPLTKDIYRFTNHPELRNLQVLDANQNPMPYRIVPATPVTSRAEEVDLRIFPVPVDTPAKVLRQLYTRIQIEGGQVEINSSAASAGKDPEFYLMDVSKMDYPLHALRLAWQPHPQNQYLELELEASRDLQNWTSLTRATLVNMGAQGLLRDKLAVEVEPHKYEFLRLRIIRGGDHLQITSVKGERQPEQVATSQEHWQLDAQPLGQVASVQAAKAVMAAWEFTRDEVTPATHVKILLGDNAYADEYALYSRTDERHNWELRHHGIWYNLRIGSEWETSDSLSVSNGSHKLWRLELVPASTALKPRLELRWQPVRLRLIANDKPPFSLVINPAVDNKHREQLYGQILAGRELSWIPTQLISLNQHPQPVITTSTINWRDWLFWGALAIAVSVLLGFALRLLRQLNAQMKES